MRYIASAFARWNAVLVLLCQEAGLLGPSSGGGADTEEKRDTTANSTSGWVNEATWTFSPC